MVTINNEELREIFNYIATIDNVIQKEIRLVKGNKSYLDKIVPKDLANIYSVKEKDALRFTDNITRLSYESSVVSLVSTFEKIAFAKYRTTYGSLRNVVSNSAPPTIDFYKSREKFVNDSIDKLSGITFLIEGHISADSLEKLKLIKDHRNYIAHGKRDVAPPDIEFKLEEIVQILDSVIWEIEH